MFPMLWQTKSGLFRSTLLWEYTLPLVVIGLLAAGFIFLIILQWRDLSRRVGTGTRWGLCVLRGLAYVLILLILLNPTLMIQKVLRLLPSLAVVLDTSNSMALPDAQNREQGQDPSTSRLDHALKYLRTGPDSPLETFAKNYQVKLYQFDETARPLSAPDLETLEANGHTTDITGSLITLLEENRATPPAGVLLLSDGGHHGSETGLDYLRQANLPVVTAGIGQPETYQDIHVASVQAPSLTFLHYPVTVQATLHIWGYPNTRIPVVLKRAGRAVSTQTVQVTPAASEYQVTFEVLPEDIGEFTYTVSVAPRLGEALTDNNTKTFPISVARDKIRVLLVCGSPTWNYRFLRQAFKHDPSVDLISFVILRTPSDVVNVPESQLSLIPFPTRRLFTQELHNFDLIVFENFSFQSYFPWYYLENVRNYVRDGGAFAMIGGRLAFAQGGYAGTPIEEILPVTMRPDRNDYRALPQRMVLTPEGMRHPITRLASDPQENERVWQSLTDLDAINLVARAKPEATVLGVSSGRFAGSPTAPLLAVQRFGKGRTLALMTDYTWKWNFQMAGQLDSNQYYLQFIRQLGRWLIRDPGLKQVRIMADATEFPLGSEVTGTVKILQDDYQPAAQATPTAQLQTPSGIGQPLSLVPTQNPGEFEYRFGADDAGLYSLDVKADIGHTTHEANRLLLRVSNLGGEQQNAAPNHALLKDIADQTGGTFFALDDPARPPLSSLVDFFGGQPDYKVLEEYRQRIRESFPVLMLILACLAVEWWWRRRVGLF
ncbi:MAG: hypothetical protein ETSY1_27015 [Candidatus Entotheonella factor]|uniref:Putative glutamine amidotransferase domain-containing protein n=1 Tax=Entotheonella factor TaxID=1429438 RepID=W4LED7_ENTF1|nr:MAG: hypothetical protein ETSY1_27015 [Candidatus Entotheonella factor]